MKHMHKRNIATVLLLCAAMVLILAACGSNSSPTSSAAPSASAVPTSSATPSASAVPTSSATPSASATPTAGAAPSASAKPTASAAPSASAAPTASAAPSVSPTAKPTATPKPTPTPHVHREVLDNAVSPTCLNTGLTEGVHCSECGEILIAQETIPVVDHYYLYGQCVWCGARDPNPNNTENEPQYQPYFPPAENITGLIEEGAVISDDSIELPEIEIP